MARLRPKASEAREVRFSTDPLLDAKVRDVLGLNNHQVKADGQRFKTYVATRAHKSGAWRGDV